ncbi:HAD-like Sugar Phosphate Phosphatase [Abortiporus biennis]
MPSTTLTFDAILFDMDGTLVDSTEGVVGAWNEFAKMYPTIDVHNILSSAHGVRTVDNLRIYCGITDPEELEREALRFEEAIVTSASAGGGRGIVALPGVKEIMNSIGEAGKLPNASWALCTSATRAYATKALAAAGVPTPDIFVASEDVKKGKPAPDPYLLGAKLLGVDPTKCLVVEDAPSGVRSGNAAGCKTLGLITSHTKQQVEEAKPTWIVENLSKVSMKKVDGGIEVVINHD